MVSKHTLGLGLVLFTWLIFFAPIISGKYVYFGGDLKEIYFPIETIYAQAQHAWQLPVWSNEFGFGQPLLAWGQLGFFTPIHLLLRALYVPPLALLQASVVLYFLVGAIGMYLFLRTRDFHQYASAIGALIFIFCGFSIGHLYHVNFYTSTMVLPWLLISLDLLMKRPSIKNSAHVALAGAIIAVSGQPQVVVFVFASAFVISLCNYVAQIRGNIKKSGKILLLTAIAGLVAVLFSSLSILPLQEFLPSTERASGLPHTELFDFSYPPYHAITLIFPYFFDGSNELAAYVGIIPLLLAGIALWNWKSHKPERIAGIFLVLFGGVMALGKYSAVYTYLIDNHYIQTIGVVGRFVYFFNIGIILLAVAGMQDIIQAHQDLKKRKARMLVSALLLPSILVALPFWLYSSLAHEADIRLAIAFQYTNPYFWVFIIGIIAVLIGILQKKLIFVIPVITAITFVMFGWNYNPRTTADIAYTQTPLLNDLSAYRQETGLPARLYAAQRLPVTSDPHRGMKLSDYISAKFSVYQPLTDIKKDLSCIILPVQADANTNATMHVIVRSGFDGQIWLQNTISEKDAFKNPTQRICFPNIPTSDASNLILSLTSASDTNMRVLVTPSTGDANDAYFVRTKDQPTPKQLKASIKPLRVEYSPEYAVTVDEGSALMIRHTQATAGASGATWIGALSVRSYRQFVDTFFANDADNPFDGDGVHALTKYRTLVNMAGVTHFTQLLDYGQTNDQMRDAGYPLVNSYDMGKGIVNLYSNPQAYPKAFMVPKATFIAADDEVRTELYKSSFNPKKIVYLSGPTPPSIPSIQPEDMQASAEITLYTQTRVDVQVTTNQLAYLVLTDSTVPEWKTYIDDKPALQLKANSVFKSAQVPKGTHIVSFRYESPATEKAKILTMIGLCIVVSLLVLPRKKAY